MSTKTTVAMLAAYKQKAMPTMFLSGQFQSPQQNYHNSEEVEIDIKRCTEKIAVAITDLSTGAHLNEASLYTNKAFKPPVFKEAGAINAFNLIKRMPGEHPFAAVDFQANAITQGIELGMELQEKILRAIEEQASQVLTTGTVTLIDESGNPVYTIDYKPKPTHFPTSAVAWDQPSPTIFKDLQDLSEVIRTDGLSNPDMLEIGEGSYELMLKDPEFLNRLDNRRINGNGIVPMDRLGNGGVFRGVIEIGNYNYDIFTYGGRFVAPGGTTSSAYLPNNKVIIRDSAGRLDATFGGIPRIGGADPRVPPALTQRVSVPGQMLDLQMNSWITPDGETMFVQAGTRPLLIPTAIDTFGCLDTGIAP